MLSIDTFAGGTGEKMDMGHDIVQATEQTVTIKIGGQNIIGTLRTVEGAPAPVLLLLHGFTGTRDELLITGTEEGAFSHTARLLADAGFSSLRIDFRGSGDSDGEWADTTFSGQISDTLAVLDWLTVNPHVDGSNLFILGWSQGGLVAAHAAAKCPDVASVVLWAPVVSPLLTYSGLFGSKSVEKALSAPAEQEIVTPLPWGGETTLKASFYQEFPVTSTAGAIAAYAGPLLVIGGTKDTVVSPQPYFRNVSSGQVLMNYHQGEGKLVMFDADHVWDVSAGPSTMDEKIIPTTIDWLKNH